MVNIEDNEDLDNPITDETITNVTCWRENSFKNKIFIGLCVLSFEILFLLSIAFINIKIKFRYDNCDVENADIIELEQGNIIPRI